MMDSQGSALVILSIEGFYFARAAVYAPALPWVTKANASVFGFVGGISPVRADWPILNAVGPNPIQNV